MELTPTKAYHVDVDGVIVEISPNNGKGFTLEEAQKSVDGYIEVVRLSDTQIMIVNEEGKFTKEYNPFATAIAELHHALLPGDYICGNVLVCPSSMLS